MARIAFMQISLTKLIFALFVMNLSLYPYHALKLDLAIYDFIYFFSFS